MSDPRIDLLTRAADICTELTAATSHIPRSLVHSTEHRGRVDSWADSKQPVAVTFYGGLPEVICTLSPAVLPVMAYMFNAHAVVAECDPQTLERQSMATVIDLAQRIVDNYSHLES